MQWSCNCGRLAIARYFRNRFSSRLIYFLLRRVFVVVRHRLFWLKAGLGMRSHLAECRCRLSNCWIQSRSGWWFDSRNGRGSSILTFSSNNWFSLRVFPPLPSFKPTRVRYRYRLMWWYSVEHPLMFLPARLFMLVSVLGCSLPKTCGHPFSRVCRERTWSWRSLESGLKTFSRRRRRVVH